MAGSLLLAVTAKSGLQTGFAILGGTGLLAVAMTILFLTDQQGQRVRPATPTRLPLGLLWPNLLVTVAGFSTYTMILPLHGLRLLDQGGRSFGQANAEAGWVLLAGGSTVFLAQASITLLKDPDPRRLLCVGSMGALPAIVALALSHSVVTMALAAAFMGGCLGLMAAANLAVISLKVEQDIQGKAAGVNAALRDLGIAIGPMIGLGLYQPGGFLPFAVGFVMIGIILLASFRT
jgi:predicted MFS family arabinose efflux permease